MEGWVNIDNSPTLLISKWPLLKEILFRTHLISQQAYETKWPKNIVQRNVTKGLNYSDNSVDKIYSSHFLEHLDRKHGEFVIRECFRVLGKRGIFRLVVPDLVFHARRYLEKVVKNDLVGREPHDEFLWNLYGAHLERRRSGASHRYMYDWPTLYCLLKEIGFDQVIHQSYRTSLDSEMEKLDNRPEDSLHIDAVK